MGSFSAEIEIRFRDIDAMGHVNNAVYATYLEQARTRYCREVLGVDLSTMPTVLANISIDYRRPVELSAGSAVVEIDVPEIGTSSLPMEYTLRVPAERDGGAEESTSSGEVVAVAESTQVTVDPETGQSRPIPDEIREAIVSYHDL
ncbi:thioesterase family protein [Halorubrum gandharaense]